MTTRASGDGRITHRTLPYALGLAVTASIQPILFSWLYGWAAPEPAPAAPLDARMFAAASLASLIAAGLALVVVQVTCARVRRPAATPVPSEENLASLLRHLSQQAASLRGRSPLDQDLSSLLTEIEAAAEHAAQVLPPEREIVVHRETGRSRPNKGIALVLAETFSLRRQLVQYLTAEGFTVVSSFLADLSLDRLLRRVPDVRLAVIESGENDFPAAEAVAALRRLHATLPVVLVAALDLSPAEAQSVLAGPGAAISRRFSGDDLKSALERALGQTSSPQSRS
ncbi:MAG: hypothetical protein U1E76_20885 [Planctomycetota bacterium]